MATVHGNWVLYCTGKCLMKSICEFFGIIIDIYYNDHVPPHFHAEYAETPGPLPHSHAGDLSRRASPPERTALVVEWAALHRTELLENWERARQGVPLQPIAPLE